MGLRLTALRQVTISVSNNTVQIINEFVIFPNPIIIYPIQNLSFHWNVYRLQIWLRLASLLRIFIKWQSVTCLV